MQGAPGANGGKTEGQRPSENAGGFMGVQVEQLALDNQLLKQKHLKN